MLSGFIKTKQNINVFGVVSFYIGIPRGKGNYNNFFTLATHCGLVNSIKKLLFKIFKTLKNYHKI